MLAGLAATAVAQTKPAGRNPATAGGISPPPDQSETVVLSPFEVVSDARGYYAPNTMSGTRFNTKIEVWHRR